MTDLDGRFLPQRHGSLLTPLAVQTHRGGDFQRHVSHANADQLGDSGSRVVEQRDQDTIAPAAPCIGIGRGEQRLNLVAGKKPEQWFVEALHRDGQYLLGQLQSWRALQGHVVGKGSHGCQARVAAAHRVMPLGFKMGQKLEHQCCIEVIQRQLGGRFAPLALDVAKQQTEGVAVSAHRSRAHVLLLHEAFGKEALEQGRKFGSIGQQGVHCDAPSA
ncbi:hypothetical protein BOO94_14165 [Pseudomonas sp. FSL W5-0299]|nr:hypothetical protein BOO94_14165 [Pseudomonas sp. FSL W5-0299]